MEFEKINYLGLIAFAGFLGVFKGYLGLLGLFSVFLVIPPDMDFKVKRLGFFGLLFTLGYWGLPFLHLFAFMWLFIFIPGEYENLKFKKENYLGLISFLGFLGPIKGVFGIFGIFSVLFVIPPVKRFKPRRLCFLGLFFTLGYYISPYLHFLGIIWVLVVIPKFSKIEV